MYSIEQLKDIANRYESRGAWSCGDPESYDWALFNLITRNTKGEMDDAKFLEITSHMAFNEGRVLSGDPNDPRLLYLKRQLNLADKRVVAYTIDDEHRQDLEIKRNRLSRMVHGRKKC